MEFYETYDYKTKRKYWWTQRDADGRCAEIRKNDNGKFELMICEAYKSTHSELQEAMDEAEKYVGNHIVGIHGEKKGKWVERKNRSPYCSLCGAVGDGGNYCSHCGVKMINGG